MNGTGASDASVAPLHVLSLATLFPDDTRPGFGIFVEHSLKALARQPGVTLTVVAPVGMPPWPLSLARRYAVLRGLPLAEERNGLIVLRPRFTLVPGLGARLNAAAIARAVLPIAQAMQADNAIDVIDAQFFHPDGPAAHRLAGALALPFSIKARGSDIARWARRAATGPAIRAAADAADGLLSVSAALKGEMVERGLPGDKIRVHHTGVDRDRFRPLDRAAARSTWDLPATAPVLLTVGALIPLKRQRLVIEAMAHLSDDTRLLIAGAGPDARALQAMAAAHGVADRVRLLGAVPQDRLASLYNAADAMVLMSEREGLANAWVEALACGTAVVLADIPPAHEAIDGADAGRICAPGAAAVAEAVRAVIANPPDRARLAARTHRRFDWQRHGAELAEHLRTVRESAAATTMPAKR